MFKGCLLRVIVSIVFYSPTASSPKESIGQDDDRWREPGSRCQVKMK